MSEFDSGSGGRKGFVRDVMRRISTPPNDQDFEDRPGVPDRTSSSRDEIEDLQNALQLFGAESPEFRRRLDRVLAEQDALRRRYRTSSEQFAGAER